ncbi:hypothetical protein B0T19DRAFT_484703 [Cercophora scortea]|uniref:NTF2 domain-containing protein n=1 Tax=Cercophora scortea TaxID=314031 RepID=A0AAE0IM37_9PEZI|nr:hypothetical protein B0T19DRAFT_484703 [Cercophora scortea]
MAVTDHEENVRRSAEAAKEFVEWYYSQLNQGKPVCSAYVDKNKSYQSASIKADITINGSPPITPEEWDAKLLSQRSPQTPSQPSTDPTTTNLMISPKVHFEIDSYDVHVINADYRAGATPAQLEKFGTKPGVRMMLMLSVSGSVAFGTTTGGSGDFDRAAATTTKQHLNDTFILVPNWDALSRAGSRNTRRYLVFSHTYRAY